MSRLSMILLDEEALDLEVSSDTDADSFDIVDSAESTIEVMEQNDSIEETLDVSESLESLRTCLNLVRNGNGVTPAIAGMIKVQLESINYQSRGVINIASFGDYSSESAADESLGLLTASVEESITLNLESLADTWKSLKESITKLVNKLFLSIDGVIREVDELSEKIKDDAAYNKSSPDKMLVKDVYLSANAKVNPLEAIKTIKEISVKTVAAAIESAQKHKATMDEVKNINKHDPDKFKAIFDSVDELYNKNSTWTGVAGKSVKDSIGGKAFTYSKGVLRVGNYFQYRHNTNVLTHVNVGVIGTNLESEIDVSTKYISSLLKETKDLLVLLKTKKSEISKLEVFYKGEEKWYSFLLDLNLISRGEIFKFYNKVSIKNDIASISNVFSHALKMASHSVSLANRMAKVLKK